jgi:hypothetical protein
MRQFFRCTTDSLIKVLAQFLGHFDRARPQWASICGEGKPYIHCVQCLLRGYEAKEASAKPLFPWSLFKTSVIISMWLQLVDGIRLASPVLGSGTTHHRLLTGR